MSNHAPQHLVLASASPRRRRLSAWLGVPFLTASVDTPESLDSPLAADPTALAISLAVEKAQAARDAHLAEDALLLCFDTIVVHDSAVLGKPKDIDDAWAVLRSLSGRTHEVVTGCAFLAPDAAGPVTLGVRTNVTMHPLDDADIERWMARGEFMGCAGAYNIEGQVAAVTDDECYQNVAGLPLCHVFAALRDPALAPWVPQGLHAPIAACDDSLCRSCRLGPKVTAAAR